MTSPSGSIGIGITLDAGDLPTEITQAVQSAMSGVLSSVRSSMTQVEGAISGIDTSGFNDIARAAQRASQASQQSTRQMTDQASRASRAVSDSMTQAVRQANNSLSRIDATALTRITRGAEDAGEELRRLDRWQLNALIQEANRAGQNLGRAIPAGASAAERSLGRLDAAGLERLIREAEEARRELARAGDQADDTADDVDSIGDAANDAANEAGKLSDAFKNVGSAVGSALGTVAKIGGVVAGAVGGISIGAVLTKGLDRLTAIDNAQAKLAGLGHTAEGVEEIMTSATAAVSGTAYGLGDAAGLAASAVAAGIEPGEKLTRTLSIMSDTAAIAGSDLSDIGDIFNEMAIGGAVTGDAISRLSGRGIPALQILADHLGKSTEAVQEMVTKGEVSFDDFQDAMEGKIGGAAQKMGETFQGAVSNMGAAMGRLGAELLQGPFAAAPDAIGKVTEGFNKLTNTVKLFQSGDYTASIGESLGVEEDSELVDKILSIREALIELGNFASGDGSLTSGDGIANLLGLDDAGAAALTDKISDIRDMVFSWGERLGAVFGGVRDIVMDLVPSLTTIAGSLAQASAAAGISVWEILLTTLEALVPILDAILVPALETLARLMEENQGVVTALVVAYTTYKTIMFATTAVQTAHTAAMSAYAAVQARANAATAAGGIIQRAQAVATGIATAAQWAFNAAMSANPITLVVIAIAALVAGLVLFFTKTELGQKIWQGFVDFLSSSWESIKAAFSAAWNFISPILQSIWDFVSTLLVGAFNALVGVVSSVFSTIGNIISSVWNGVISPIFNFWRTMITGVLIPVVMFLWNSAIKPAFEGIGSIIRTVWDTVISVVFTAIRTGMDAVGAAANWLWNNAIKPAWDGIGAAISFVWNSIILPVFDAIKVGMDGVGAAASWLWNEVITPVWNGIGDAIKWVIDNVIIPAWDGMKSALQAVGDFFGTIVEGIKGVWNGLRNILAKPINFMIGTVYNDGIRKAWNKIGEFIPGLVSAPELSLIPEFRKGGALRGPGTGTSDDILMWGSNGEHMVTAMEVVKAGGHNILYAIRDMIARGIPFTWDNGRVISQVGEGNLSRYGAAVQRKGLGNVDPEGLFNPIFAPKYKDGGEIKLEPWMLQLAKGHRFAQAQHGKPYQWAGPTGPGSSFDCSGFMGSIAAEILGGDPWRRYWATASFAGYPSVGPQGFTKGLGAGFTIGVTDDPGGPGGGHTAGVLGEVPGLFRTARVESGGAIGDVHYGAGPDVRSFAATYTLPIGANGFFQPGEGMSVGPTPEEQRSFLAEKVHDVLSGIVEPIKGMFASAIGTPPPHWKGIPPQYLDAGVDAVADGTDKVIGNLGDMLSSAWTAAKGLGANLLDSLNPFDSGGLAFGKGFLPKNIIAPERVLSPEQTRLFEILVQSLQALSKGDYDGGLSRVGIEEDHPFVDAALTLREVATSVDALVNKGDYDGQLARFGIEEDHAIVDAVLTMREVATSVDALVNKGDYDGTLARFGIEEDHALIDAVLTMRETSQSINNLLGNGDYDGVLSRFGIEEDHPIVDAALSMRDTVLAVQEIAGSVGTLVEEGDYDGKLANYGIDEDHPFIDALFDVRDAVVGALGDSAVKVAGDLIDAMAPDPKDLAEKIDPDTLAFMQRTDEKLTEQGEILSETVELAKRTESSQALVIAEQYRELERQLVDIANRLTGGVLGPVVQSAMQSALGLVEKALSASTGDVVSSQDATTDAVKDLAKTGGAASAEPAPPFGAPGSAFDFATELSNAIVSVTDTASQAIMQVGMDVAKAALQQQKSTVDSPRGVLGDDNNSGGFLVDTIVRLTGVEIQIRDTIYAVADEIKSFRGDQFQTITETGELISDTASMLERSASSTDLVIAEQNRINRELLKSVLRYLMLNVVLPILMALMTAMITLAVTAIGAAIGAAIAGPIGLALGAALGGIVGLAMSAVAATIIGGIGLGAGAAIDSFDQGGLANGIGVLPKNTIQPERVLSPRQTASFERLVDLLDGAGLSGGGGQRTVQVGSINVHGTQAAEKTSDRLLSLLNS